MGSVGSMPWCYAREGARVVVVDIVDGSATVDAVKEAGGQAIYVKCDITRPEDCEAAAMAAVENFGSVDVLINNAAIYASLVVRPFTEVTAEDWNKVMQVNTLGPFNFIKAVFPFMKESGGGKIINISSCTVLEGAKGLPHYVTSKAAVIGLTRVMARELGEHNIHVNTIMPGYTQSEATLRISENSNIPPDEIEKSQVVNRCLKRSAQPDDLVGSALFLGSEMCGMITGQIIVHDGGLNFI